MLSGPLPIARRSEAEILYDDTSFDSAVGGRWA